MKFETKYKIGQEVYYIDELRNSQNKLIEVVCKDKIENITIYCNYYKSDTMKVDGFPVSIGYYLVKSDKTLCEEGLFATREEAEKELEEIGE